MATTGKRKLSSQRGTPVVPGRKFQRKLYCLRGMENKHSHDIAQRIASMFDASKESLCLELICGDHFVQMCSRSQCAAQTATLIEQSNTPFALFVACYITRCRMIQCHRDQSKRLLQFCIQQAARHRRLVHVKLKWLFVSKQKDK